MCIVYWADTDTGKKVDDINIPIGVNFKRRRRVCVTMVIRVSVIAIIDGVGAGRRGCDFVRAWKDGSGNASWRHHSTGMCARISSKSSSAILAFDTYRMTESTHDANDVDRTKARTRRL